MQNLSASAAGKRRGGAGRGLVALAGLLLCCSGCRALAGYERAGTSPDGPGDVGVALEAAPPEAGTNADVRPDAGPPDVSLPDLPPTDGPNHDATADVGADAVLAPDAPTPVDQMLPPDLTLVSEAGICSETEVVTQQFTCSKQHAGCTVGVSPDKDCDGLLDGLDPDLACNVLGHVETFSTTASLTEWSGVTANGCALPLGPTGTVRYSVKQPAAGFWMIGFKYVDDPQVDKRGIGLTAEVKSATEYRYCKVEVNAGSLWLKVSVKALGDPSEQTTVTKGKVSDVVKGAYYMLATWSEGNDHLCALYDAAGAKIVFTKHLHSAPLSGNANLKITTSSLPIDVDHARFYWRAP